MVQTISSIEETKIYCDVARRHDFAFLIDVTNGNPNGDPDAGNAPRVDPETMKGLISDVCVKRKVRDWMDMTHGTEPGYEIYIKSRDIGLNDLHKLAHDAVFPSEEKFNGKETDNSRQHGRRDWLCKRYYDIRCFGAVMGTGDFPAGQVHGPIQIVFSRSIDAIMPLDISITRVAVADIDPKKKTTSTMGRKFIIPYGLYLGYGFFNVHFAKQTGFSNEDLKLFWDAFKGMWDVDRSAARGMMALHGLYVFSHEHHLGNAPAHQLFDLISIEKKEGIEAPRQIEDYNIHVDDSSMPEGVMLTKMA